MHIDYYFLILNRSVYPIMVVFAGARVYLACRNLEAGKDTVLKLRKKTGNPAIHLLRLDLQDFNSIRSFVESFLKCEFWHE